MYDVIIVGGGVIGASIAYHLSHSRKRILVIERDTIGSHASSAAAGMLGVQLEMKPNSPLFELARASYSRFPDLVNRLEREIKAPLHFNQAGSLRLAETEEELISLAQLQQAQAAIGLTSQLLTYDQICMLEHGISPSIKGGMYVSDGQLEAAQLTPSLMKAVVAQGGDVLEKTTVLSLAIDRNEICGVDTTKGKFLAEAVVLAGGAWTNQLLPDFYQFPLYPVKGEAFAVRLLASKLTHTLFTSHCYIVPKAGNRLLIGATESAHEWDPIVKMKGLLQLIQKAATIYPAISEGEFEKTWAGIRPQTKDGLPFLGFDPDIHGLIHATGHFRNGILLSAITGEIVADLLIHGKTSFNLQPFLPGRWRGNHVISE